MTKREDQLGSALAQEIAAQFETLSFGDLLTLRAIYSKAKGKGWEQLPPHLKEKFAGLAVAFLKRLSSMTPA